MKKKFKIILFRDTSRTIKIYIIFNINIDKYRIKLKYYRVIKLFLNVIFENNSYTINSYQKSYNLYYKIRVS